LRIYALGNLRLSTGTGSISGDWLGQRAGQLLRYLITQRNNLVPIEVIAEAVWPNASFNTSSTVRHCVYILRNKLEPDRPGGGSGRFVVGRRGGYMLNPSAVTVDVDAFERAANDGLESFARGEAAVARERLESAVSLYRGDFLSDDPYAEWALVERERLRELVAAPLGALVELTKDQPELALMYLERLATLEPFDNDIQHQLISLLVRLGKLSRAVRQYHAFELRLLREFNDGPNFGLSELLIPRRGRLQS
jgi:DNA-binding SARP family transcriptional activator